MVDEITLTAQVPASISKKAIANGIVYPDPANDILRFSTELDIQHISIFNMLGQTLISSDIIANTIDVSSLDAGIYVAKLKDVDNNVLITRFKKN